MHKGVPKIEAKLVTSLNEMELEDLCDATAEIMRDINGFNIGTQTIDPIEKSKLVSYWEGVLLVPERRLIIGRLDGTIAGSVQIIIPSPSNHTSAFACSLDNHFVAPWARRYGLSNLLLEYAEKEAKKLGMSVIKLSVRETRHAAISVFEKRKYTRWGILPKYEMDQGKIVSGYFYYKEI